MKKLQTFVAPSYVYDSGAPIQDVFNFFSFFLYDKLNSRHPYTHVEIPRNIVDISRNLA